MAIRQIVVKRQRKEWRWYQSVFSFCPKKLTGYHNTSLERPLNECKIYHPHPYVYQLWKFGEDRSSRLHSKIFGGIYRIFSIFFHTGTQMSHVIAEVIEPTFTKCLQGCRLIHCAPYAAIGVPIFQCVSERQCSEWRKVGQLGHTIGCHSNVPWAIKKEDQIHDI